MQLIVEIDRQAISQDLAGCARPKMRGAVTEEKHHSDGMSAGWARPLRLHLSSLIVCLLLGVSLPLMWLTYEQGTRTAIDAASREMDLLSDRVIDHYNTIFGDGLSAVTLTSAADIFLDEPPAGTEAKTAFLAKALAASIHTDSLYVGYPTGALVQAVDITGNPAWREALSAPEESSYAVRTIEKTAAEKRQTWRYYRADGQLLGERVSDEVSYDPRRRPWYKTASRRDGPVTVGPYTMATTEKLGLTVATAMEGSKSVVVGVDVLLEMISHLLSREAVSPNAVGYVFDAAGRLIVHSDSQVMERILESLSVKARDEETDFGDPLLGAVQGLLEAATQPEQVLRFDAAGRSYLARVAALRGADPLEGNTVVIVAPLSDFTGPSLKLLYKALAVAAALIGIGIVSALVLSRLISRSLAGLAGSAREIGELELDAADPPHSHITEINTLGRALASARAAIRSFALYVPRELVRKVIVTGQQAAGSAVRQDVTVLFSDIRDFTTVSEQRSPEEVVALLSVYFERLNAVIERHSGVVVQYLGDSIYAMWNAPEPDLDHVSHACRCALALAAEVEALNAENRAAGAPELVTRFGLHTGVAVVGNVGATKRQQYTAMGDTVNVASRLEGMNKEYGTTILVSGAVRERAGPSFRFRPLGMARAKGRAGEIEIFELVGANE
jgi:adenylate cyclase